MMFHPGCRLFIAQMRNSLEKLHSYFLFAGGKYIHVGAFRTYRKIVLLSAILLGFALHFPYSFAQTEEKLFIVTAYYSPLPNQTFYFKGSYEAEVRLNGQGTHGASGKGVFAGMLAAPKTYPFGTKIYLDGVGLGVVEDRGGAIVVAGERGQAYDRIDVWMGYGEIGLKRALLWGRRQVKGTIVTDDAGHQRIDLAAFDRGDMDLSKLPVVRSASTNAQERLIHLGYESYGKLEDMVFAFQKDYGVVSSRADLGAGNYGPKTQAKLEEVYTRYTKIRLEEEALIQASKEELLGAREDWKAEQQKAQVYIETLGTPRIGDKGSHVRELQIFLKSLGYFKSKDTGIMGVNTVAALKKYQKERGLPENGRLDIPTKTALAGDKLFIKEKWE